MRKSINRRANHVVRIRRTVRLGQNVTHTHRFENGTHRAAGNNAQYVTMLGRDPGQSKILGLAIGNGYAAVAGALIVQSRGSATQDMGLGMIVIGLASVIIGLSLFGRVRLLRPTTQVILGSVLYQACLVLASAVGLPSAYNKLLMAVLFTVALVLSSVKKKGKRVAA